MFNIMLYFTSMSYLINFSAVHLYFVFVYSLVQLYFVKRPEILAAVKNTAGKLSGLLTKYIKADTVWSSIAYV